MNRYLAILKARFSVLLQYRAAALAGLVTQLFWGLVKAMILAAFYSQAGQNNLPISLAQGMTFIWLGQAFLHLLPWNIDKEIETDIKNGNVAYELIRPLDLYWLWFSRAFALRLVPSIMRSIPIFLLASLFLDLAPPVSSAAAFTFALSLTFSALLSTAITTLVIISLFWTISGEGILRLLPAIVVIFSGLLVPLPLFPNSIQIFLNIQPFRCILDIPCRLYTGIIPISEAPYFLAFQLLWGIIFIAIGKKVMQKASNRFIIHGG